MPSATPAAQYLRMSSEEQRYSLVNQAAAIGEFAEAHGFTVVKTYSDAGRSGLTLASRLGLRQLLSDISSGQCSYRAVLVYDVSRWGRFQDPDESAHYEFLCKSAGVSLHYCSETFDNDCSLENTLMKALKRSMAAMFSRELGKQVYTSKRTIAAAGFSVGGRTPFGFRRQIVSVDKNRCYVLEAGERKYLKSERIILVRGPKDEVSCVREIFRNVLKKRMTAREISRNLNANGRKRRNRRWTQELVHHVLTNPVYAGVNTWGRTSRRLASPLTNVASSSWVLVPNAFTPIVSKYEFKRAQELLQVESGRIFWTRARILEAAKNILRARGKLSLGLFDSTPGCPNAETVRRGGGFAEICRAVGYELPGRFHSASIGITQAWRLHREILLRIAKQVPGEFSITKGAWPRLLLNSETSVSLLVCRRLRDCRNAPRWRLTPRLRDSELTTIVCLLDSANAGPASFFIFPRIPFSGRHQFEIDDPWLKTGDRVENDAELYSRITRSVSPTRRENWLSRKSIAVD